MATVEQKRATPGGRAERDPQVYHPLDRLRGIIRRYVVIEGVLSAILFVAAWFTLGLILDYGLFKVVGWDWVQDGSSWVRVLALVTAVVLFALILVFRIATRLTKEFSYASLALVLERRFPKVLGDRLITAVEMADVDAMGKFGYSKDMIRATIAEARERVAKVPVSQVFNWRRLWVLGFLTVALVFATVAFSYATYAVAASPDPYRFGWKFAHVTGIFMERNVLIQDTPWPRRAHLDLVDFPENGELTVGRDAPPPRITARAYRWVIADKHQPTGWRPLRWDDLTPEFVGRSVPELPKRVTSAEPALTVDTVERVAYETDEQVSPEAAALREQIKKDMNAGHSQGYEELQEVFKALLAKADQPSMGRTLRRLDVPGGVNYKYSGRRSGGNGALSPQQNNEFAGEIAGLKEDVEFIVKGADFTTVPKKIRLIPPPSLKRMGREQSEPAYLHHAPPQGEGYNALKGRLQKVNAKDLSLTGDATVFAVPAGTELTLTAEAYTGDNNVVSDIDRIVSAYAKPISGRFPGTVYDAEGKPTEALVPLKVLDGEKFVIDFRNNPRDPANPGKNTDFRLMDSVKFELIWVNQYNISARRVVTIQVVQDQPPTVEMAVDVIRKVGNVYLVTPKARIPFNPDSYIKDDHGLSKVEYVFSYYAEDSDIVRAYRVKYAMRSMLDVPLPGTGVTAYTPRLHADNFRILDKADDKLTASVFVSEFNNQLNLVRRDTRSQFESLLQTAMSEDTPAQSVRKVELRDAGRDYFDLKELNDLGLIKLMPKSDFDTQSIFRMDLNVQATDNNVDNADGPRVVRNLEPIRLRIVPESDLLVEMGKEELQLAERLDEAITKLEAARRKYEFVRSNNGFQQETPEQVDAVKVRALDALGDVEKARDVVQSVVRDMQRLQRECEVNRLNAAALKGFKDRTDVLLDVLSEKPDEEKGTFPQAQAQMNQVQNALNTGRWAPLTTVTQAQIELSKLDKTMRAIRVLFGDAGTRERLKNELLKIKGEQARIGDQIKAWKKKLEDEYLLEYPTFGDVGVLAFSKGETKQVSQTIQWNRYKKDDIVVKLAVYDAANNLVLDAIAVPAELKLDFEKHQFRFTYELKALNKEGNFKVRLTPALGPPVDVQVIVK